MFGAIITVDYRTGIQEVIRVRIQYQYQHQFRRVV
jgi:hypothetical protein